VPIAFVAALIGTSALAFFAFIGRVLLFLVAGSYLLVNLASSVWTVRKNGWRHLLLLPIVYLTLHLSWGIGFLFGLIKFRTRWRDNPTHAPTLRNMATATEAAARFQKQMPAY
jgi:ABC-type polysaccharide/polyol phosphate export permease